MPTIADLCNVLDGQLIQGDMLDDVSGLPLGTVVTDSRNVEPGDIFWALQGEKRQGETFVGDAFRRGAAGAVVAKHVSVPEFHWVIRVADAQQSLWTWAASQRSQCSGDVIAVTGSVGKTTTRQMIHTVLQSHMKGVASPKNYNNHVGVPLSMLTFTPEHDYAVLELAANRPGEIAALATLVAPKIAVITRVGDAHLSGFGDRHGIARAKAELLSALPPDGHAILGDDPWLRKVADACPVDITWVGTSADCDIRAEQIQSTHGQLSLEVEGCRFVVPVWGRHHVTAVLAAIAVGRRMGLSLDKMARALQRFQPVPMRCQVQEMHGVTLVNDAYNSNPTAMEAALELLRDFETAGRRIVLCGDMGELGDGSPGLHWELGRQIVLLGRADMLIACGQFARHVVGGARAAGLPRLCAIACESAKGSIPYLAQAMLPGDVVLIKGSRMMAMEQIMQAIEHCPNRRVA